MIVPLTVVPFSEHVAPLGTRRLSTVMAPTERLQVNSSADALGAEAKVSPAASASVMVRCVFISFSLSRSTCSMT